jgi:hypothetical protein
LEFICISYELNQFLTFIYALKLISDFQYSLDWASNSDEYRGYGVNVSKTQRVPGMDGGLFSVLVRVSLAMLTRQRGITA